MATTGSVSKGLFVFKGKKKAAKSEEYFCTEGDRNLTARYEAFDSMWEQISESIQILQADMNTNIFSELMKFTQQAHKGFSLEGSQNRSLRETPTAALITGVNMPDHSVMFANLSQALRENVTPHVAVLRSKDCINIKTAIDKTVVQFMQNTDVLEDEDNEDVMNLKRVSCTMSMLSSWYRQNVRNTSQLNSPRKRKSVGCGTSEVAQCPPLVVILEDLEGFAAHVLQDFVTICSNYQPELPLVLVFGIATAVTAVHRLLPHQVSSLLCIEKFQALPPTEYLSQVINEVVISAEYPCKFGSRVFKLLIDLFLFHDFSVVSFINGIQIFFTLENYQQRARPTLENDLESSLLYDKHDKLCLISGSSYQLCPHLLQIESSVMILSMFALMDHYLKHAHSILCVPLDVVVDTLKEMTSQDLDIIRRLQSFRRHVEGCDPKEQINLLNDDKHTKKFFLQCLERLHDHADEAIYALRCLHVLTSFLPGYPLGKQVRQMYAEYLESNIYQTEAYKDSFALLRNLSREELRKCIASCVEILSDKNIPERLISSAKEIQELGSKIDNLEELAHLYETEDKDESEEEKSALSEKMNMYALRQKLQEMQKKKKKLSAYEIIRNETLDYMDKFFREFLVCPRHLPLHEILYYDDYQTVKQHVNGSPRASIQTALSNPYYYLQNEACRCEEGGFSATLPDICIVYKLHLECGRLINLYDWMQAFATVLASDADNEEEPQKPDKVIQARFIRAVSELQVLGFIKPTKRKTDHVARLTWGGC